MAKKLKKKKKETKQIKTQLPIALKKREKKNLTEDMQDHYTENKKTFLRDKLKAISHS